ncbi:MAG: hypothetical protein H0X70_00830 [Segetibacter sp.]|jgi:hypothetical protein|nr:hypothetical protein [Segetibacter sp.]
MTLENRIISLAKNSIARPSNVKIEVIINTITVEEAALLKDRFGIQIEGYVRKIDNFSIIHTYKNHGNAAKEEKRGQVAITVADFALIIEIAKVENSVYIGKNKLGRDCILYRYKKENVYCYIEIRTGKKEIVMNTMYKIKPPRK